MTELTPAQRALRDRLERTVDWEIVVQGANTFSELFLDSLNIPRLREDNSMMIRFLVARALMGTAAEWLADRAKAPKPDGYAVGIDVIANPPAIVVDHCWKDPDIAIRNAERDAGVSYVSYADGVTILAAQGFTNHFETSENGDMGPRHYFYRDGAATNDHGRPIETAQLDNWGGDNWTVTMPEAR